MEIEYISLFIFGVNTISVFAFAIRKGGGWWSAFLGWLVAVISQLQIIALR